jgi:hypothetical protein
MSTAALRPRPRRADPLDRFTAAYACITVAASVAALGLQTFGHFTGLLGATLVLVAMPAVISAIALGCSSAVALAGVVQGLFFSHAVHVKSAQRDMFAAK